MSSNGKGNGKSTQTQRELRVAASRTRATRRLRLITAAEIDGRTMVGRQFNQIVRNVTNDLGGNDHISEVERHLIVSFTGAAILQGHQIAKLVAGEQIDIDEYSAITTSMIRSATRLGTQRRAKEVHPNLSQYLEGESE